MNTVHIVVIPFMLKDVLKSHLIMLVKKRLC